MRQLHFKFSKKLQKPKEILAHGGSDLPRKRMGPRPLVMKCTKQIFEDRNVIIGTLISYSQDFHVPIYSFATGPDHIHSITKVPSRAAYVKFIRAVTGLLGKLLGAGLFASVAFTRIASWGRDYFGLLRYTQQNWEEACGRKPYKPRKKKKPA